MAETGVTMSTILVLIVAAVAISGIALVMWRYWQEQLDMSADEDQYEREVAALNEKQANRYTDDELGDLSRRLDDDLAWQIMVRRGRRRGRTRAAPSRPNRRPRR